MKDLTYEEINMETQATVCRKTGSVPVPTLEEVFEWAADAEFLLNVELKTALSAMKGWKKSDVDD
ncbi:hypothetical protein PO124_08870 [Bacillus licheniformis]|nr:hypothetical protein [Bacillus licheniformis]